MNREILTKQITVKHNVTEDCIDCNYLDKERIACTLFRRDLNFNYRTKIVYKCPECVEACEVAEK